jgi:hypothetical protein
MKNMVYIGRFFPLYSLYILINVEKEEKKVNKYGLIVRQYEILLYI